MSILKRIKGLMKLKDLKISEIIIYAIIALIVLVALLFIAKAAIKWFLIIGVSYAVYRFIFGKRKS